MSIASIIESVRSSTSSPTQAFVLAAALTALAAPARAQPYHLDDSLRGTTSGNALGGSFSAAGWTVTAVGDRIWYALPRLASGYAEFTVANVTLATLPLGDHEVFAMYEAGYGIAEPIRYSPEFRGNHYKMLVRIYGTPEPDRAGSMKLMWGMCPSGAPGYDACGCASFFEEPYADPGPWTGAPVRVRVEWGGGRSRLLRDGVEVVGVDWSGAGFPFGPSELHMMIGSPRNDGGLSAMPIGAVFSDLVVDGEMGPLATCPGTTLPDAGPPSDGGTCAGSAIADVTAASWEPGVFPDVSDLNVEATLGNPTAMVYLRFPPVAGPVSSATLTMNTSGGPSAGGGSGVACRVDDGAWDEATLTWSTRPAVSAVCSGGARTVGASEMVSWDVTSLVGPGGDVTLAIVSEDPDGAHYLSREAGGCTLGPRLDVTLAPGMDAAIAVDGGMDATVDGSRIDSGRTDPDAGGRGTLSSGCGCAVAASRPSVSLGVLALLFAALVSRKRG